MPKLLRSALCAAAACAAALAATNAAAVTFSDASGQYTVGIGPDGELYDNNTGVGLAGPAGDYIAPGTPRDSWGVTSTLGSAYADYQQFGTAGITATTTIPGVNTATLVSATSVGLSVSQTYTFVSPNILSIQETVTNIGKQTATDVVFRRNVDFDVSPFPWNNDQASGPVGTYSKVRGATSQGGFDGADPALPFSNLCSPSCAATGDLDLGIDVSLGNLAAGQSATVTYFYGMNMPGQTLAQLIAEAKADHIAFLIPDESTVSPGSAFLGVGVVPEPATWAMMLLGVAGLGGVLRARRRADQRLRTLEA